MDKIQAFPVADNLVFRVVPDSVAPVCPHFGEQGTRSGHAGLRQGHEGRGRKRAGLSATNNPIRPASNRQINAGGRSQKTKAIMTKILFCGMLTLMLMCSLTNEGQEEHGYRAANQDYSAEITYNLHLIQDLCRNHATIAAQRRIIDSLHNHSTP